MTLSLHKLRVFSQPTGSPRPCSVDARYARYRAGIVDCSYAASFLTRCYAALRRPSPSLRSGETSSQATYRIWRTLWPF